MFDWTYDPNRLFVYAMLKKILNLLHLSTKLSEGGFGQNYTPVQYFGINEDSNKNYTKMSMFYFIIHTTTLQ